MTEKEFAVMFVRKKRLHWVSAGLAEYAPFLLAPTNRKRMMHATMRLCQCNVPPLRGHAPLCSTAEARLIHAWHIGRGMVFFSCWAVVEQVFSPYNIGAPTLAWVRVLNVSFCSPWCRLELPDGFRVAVEWLQHMIFSLRSLAVNMMACMLSYDLRFTRTSWLTPWTRYSYQYQWWRNITQDLKLQRTVFWSHKGAG